MEEENDNNINTQNKNKKKSRLFKVVYLGVILIIVQIIFLVAFRFAKYKETYKGSASAEIAKMICEMDVVPSEDNKSIINPYCNIIVRNYDESNKVSETDINYTIQVITKDNLELPGYYWEDAEGTKLQENSNLAGKFENGVKDEKEYKIVFINSGEKDINRKIEFKLTATQAID